MTLQWGYSCRVVDLIAHMATADKVRAEAHMFMAVAQEFGWGSRLLCVCGLSDTLLHALQHSIPSQACMC